MASNLTSGYVLKPLKVAPTNATSTATPINGVVRDVKPVPGSFDFGVAGSVLDVAGDQYRTAFLEGPNQEPAEYLVWAANNSNLALVEDDSWSVTDGTGHIPTGTVSVLDISSPDDGQRTDGSTRLVVSDNGARSLAKILSLKVIRGDDPSRVEHTLVYPTDFTVLDADTGLLFLEDNATTQTALTPSPGEPPAFSSLRRDSITEVSYVLAPAKFWWTRNDAYQTRFSWNGRTQRWEPLCGGSPSNLGALAPLETYFLQPTPEGLVEGAYLPGSTTPDAYSMLRVGFSPDANSLPVAPNPGGPFEGVLVVTDASAANVFDFSAYAPPPAAVVGVTSGLLQWNQNFVAQNAGLSIWYVSQTFDPESRGQVGLLIDAQSTPLHIAPVPGPTENPLLRIGSRRYLTVLPVATEAEQDAIPSVLEGTVSVAWSTGRLRFSLDDIAKADQGDLGFDIRFLGAEVFYDGVSLNREAQPVRAPLVAVGTGGTEEQIADANLLYLRNAAPLPGLGTSGVLHIPDGTGAIPTAGAAHLRPGGDDVGPGYSGLLRWVEGVGDIILFTRLGAIAEIVVVDTPADIPQFRFNIPQGTGYITRSLEEVSNVPVGSIVELGSTDRQALSGALLYFVQAELVPAQYTEEARVFSRVRHTFALDGTEVLHFSMDGFLNSKTVAPSGAGTYTAAEIAAHLNTGLGSGRAYALFGHVVLEAETPSAGSVEIGFGSSTRDLSGAAALGFLPGWRVDTSDVDTFWLSDSGISVGLFRSPLNLDRSVGVPDTQARVRFEEEVLVSSTQPQPFVFLNSPPLRDIAGFDEDVFFKAISGDGERQLRNLYEVEYRFEEQQPSYAWLEEHSEQAAITRPATALNLQRTNISEPTLLEVAGGGLHVSEDGGVLLRQGLGTDYLLDAEGSTGGVTLIEQIGGRVASGARGSFTASSATFTDLAATFQTDGVGPGHQIKILSGVATGQSFIVATVPTETTLTVSPVFPVSSGSIPAAWDVYEGQSADVYDPGLLADVVYEEFNHLSEEPFKICLLSSIGSIPATEGEQEASRNVAFVADAIERGRITAVRFGLEDRNSEVSLTPLLSHNLGLVANGLVIPNALADAHFVLQDFSIRVGSTQFTQGVDLLPVLSFTVPAPATGTIEYLTGSGELSFAVDLLLEYQQAFVLYEQEFITTIAQVPLGTAELDTLTGELNFNADDILHHQGKTGYFVEQMVTEGRVDVVVNPLAGAFAFFQPMREGQIVETRYFVADNQGGQSLDEDGNPIEVIEFLPLFVRSEVASRVSSQEYSFNSALKTVDTRVDSSVYIDVNRQNYGARTTAEVVFDPAPKIYFQGVTVDVASVVKISYAVLEAFGGETAYSTSRRPVYRPPFFLGEGQSTFTLEGDRTADLVPGKVLRLGARPLYVRSVAWNAALGTTEVTVYPTLDQEVGIRAPGNDVLSLLTSVPVATVVGNTPTTADAGFLLAVASPYAPVRRGTREIRFEGDLTRFAVAGHLIEVGGVPFLVTDSRQSEDGATTSIEVSVAFPREYQYGTDTVKLSVRPIYPNGALQFLGLSPLLLSESFELVLFGERGDNVGDVLPGRTLELGVEYEIDDSSGAVTLIEGNQDGLRADQRLFLRYTKLKSLSPRLGSGYVILPRFRADFHHVTVPSEGNRFLGTSVLGTFTFRNPDSFFFQVDTLEGFLAEIQQDQVALLASQTPSGGPISTVSASTGNQDKGSSGFDAQWRSLQDRDRAGRALLDFYNSTISSFEQVQETFNGLLVGDRDGKFRHFVGRGARFAPPGFEDEITGYLVPRYLWSEVFLSETSDRVVPLRALADDPLLDPATAVLADAELQGDLPLPDVLKSLIAAQGVLLRNDVDDLLLTQRGVLRAVLSGFPPVRLFQATGVHKSMAEPQPFSRLFPTTTTAFTTTVPGLGADLALSDLGVYAYRRTVTNFEGVTETVSTYQQPIATLSNPVLGVLTNLVDVAISERRPRARVVSYSEVGYSDVNIASAGVPAVLLSVVPLSDFPVDTSTGLPDTTRLRSQVLSDTAVFDIATGNMDLHTPPFAPGQQLALGRANGDVVSLRYAREKVTVQGVEFFGGVYVKEVLSGCVITFQGKVGDILNPVDLVSVDADGLPVAVEILPGDSLFVIPESSTDIEPADPPTQEDIQRLASSLASYRLGVDLDVNRQTGEVLDITQSSYADPSNLALKEILGQNPPEPGTDIEALASFSSGRVKHVSIPALESQPFDDSGDESVPFKTRTETEQVLLREAAQALVELRADSPTPSAVYPEEVLGEDGQVIGVLAGGLPPATLLTQEDALPVTTAGSYTPHSALGDVRQYDLLLVQVDDTEADIPKGSQGILSVGAVSGSGGYSFLEPPRFVTQTRVGDRIRYQLDNAMVHLAPVPGASGVTVAESGGNTILTFTGVGFSLDDGNGTSQGGLNNILNNTLLSFPNENSITLRLFDQSTGLLLESITLSGDPVPTVAAVPSSSSTGGLGTVYNAAQIVIGNGVITCPVIGFVDFVALGGAAPGPVGPFDVAISIDTHSAGLSGGQVYKGSDTAFVGSDRLTFVETVDVSTARKRGDTTSGAVGIALSLAVITVTSPDTEDMTVNAPSEINGGSPFTFLERVAGVIGSFQAATSGGAGDESGSVRVMAWEGAGNTPILSTGATQFSAVPSSSYDTSGVVCQGEGGCNGDSEQFNIRVTDIDVLSGSLASVVQGDILVIDKAADPAGATYPGSLATTKAGTYLVRQVVESNDTVSHPDRRELTLAANAGDGFGWLDARFPSVVGYNDITKQLTVSAIPLVSESPTTHAFPSTGRVYVLANLAELDNAGDFTAYKSAVVSAAYGSISLVDNRFDTLSDFRDAGGVVIASSVFAAAAVSGVQVSGMAYFQVQVGGEQGLPSRNVVGRNTVDATHGVRHFSIQGDVVTSSAAASLFYDGSAGEIEDSAGGGVYIIVTPKTPTSSTSFVPDLDTPVFPNIPGVVHISDIPSADWESLHKPAAHPTSLVECILPGESFVTESSGSSPGFWAQAAIFLEPSWPLPTQDLSNTSANLVDFNHTLPANRLWMRDINNFIPGVVTVERVSFEIRRVRRFGYGMQSILSAVQSLQFTYAIRRGEVVSYTGTKQMGIVDTNGTQLGPFDDPRVNINPGDSFRLLDATGAVVEEVPILGVRSGTELLLAAPGLTFPLLGSDFEVYLRQPLVPHEQSHAQLLELATNEVVLETVADYGTGDGGYADSTGVLKDTGVTGVGASTFSALGVQEGDYLVIDPAGELTPSGAPTVRERGEPPIGDRGVSTRVDGSYASGRPGEIDDNRGFYRVVEVNADNLVLSGVSEFAGDTTSGDVIFGSGGWEFVLYPTIHDSLLIGGGVEGQNDLRKTALAGTNGSPAGSYQGNAFSVAPFSYQVVRPTGLLSIATVELLLMLRERFLSWQEILEQWVMEGGTYFIFQRDAQAEDLSLGVLSVVLTAELEGQDGITPFANDADTLSVLDRRFWTLDAQLDYTSPPFIGGSPYTDFIAGQGRPVFPDHIELVLGNRDNLRDFRSVWLDYRVNLVSGTLASIRRYSAQEPQREEDQRNLLRFR